MRIIAGTMRGRKIKVPGGRGVRPTSDRMRESIFSALGDACSRARVLDLFAGSGALGFEAISRGAREAVLVDKSPSALRAIRQNAS